MYDHKLNYRHVFMICAGVIFLIIISIPISSFFGSANLTFSQIVEVYQFKFNPLKYPLEQKNLYNIVWQLRLPRAILAICVGGGLAICGTVMQALTRNVMAEPYTLGVASGASFMAALSISFLGDRGITPSLGAFLGAFIAMVLVYIIATDTYGASSTKLILTGVGVSMIFSAITQLVIALASNGQKVKSIVYWTMGSLGGARWDNIWLPTVVFILGGIILCLHAETLNLLSMGNETATTLGVDVSNIQKRLVIILSAITGVMVAASGTIGFVGLIVPHTIRFFLGADHRKILPVTLLAGGLFLIWVDSMARCILSPQELPVGVLTALLGGPFFLALLKKNR